MHLSWAKERNESFSLKGIWLCESKFELSTSCSLCLPFSVCLLCEFESVIAWRLSCASLSVCLPSVSVYVFICVVCMGLSVVIYIFLDGLTKELCSLYGRSRNPLHEEGMGGFTEIFNSVLRRISSLGSKWLRQQIFTNVTVCQSIFTELDSFGRLL